MIIFAGMVILSLALLFIVYKLALTQDEVTEGKWQASWVCTECNEPLSWNEKMYSYGVCPYCGHHSNSTVCDVVTKVFKRQNGKVIFKEEKLEVGFGNTRK